MLCVVEEEAPLFLQLPEGCPLPGCTVQLSGSRAPHPFLMHRLSKPRAWDGHHGPCLSQDRGCGCCFPLPGVPLVASWGWLRRGRVCPHGYPQTRLKGQGFPWPVS